MMLFERVIDHYPDSLTEIRLSVSELNGNEYLSLREYYQDFNEEWFPGKKGISIPFTLENTKNLFSALAEILSEAEKSEIILAVINKP